MQIQQDTIEQNGSTEVPQLLTAARLAAILDISVRTLRRLQATGRLPHSIRLGGSVRWRAEEVQAWIDAGCPRIVD